MSGGRRDFSSVSEVRAERYDLLVEDEVADEMQNALTQMGPAPQTERR